MPILDKKTWGVSSLSADPVLSERTWDAISAGEVTPGGAFGDELTSYWNHVSGMFDLDTPPNVDLGDEVGVVLYGQNQGSEYQRMYMSISIFSPSGVEYFTSSVEQSVYPGGYMPFYATEVVHEDGDWTAEATLYVETEQVDTWQGKIGTVGEVEVGKPLPLKWIGIAGAALGALILLKPKRKGLTKK